MMRIPKKIIKDEFKYLVLPETRETQRRKSDQRRILGFVRDIVNAGRKDHITLKVFNRIILQLYDEIENL